MHGTYDPGLVALSVLIAVVAAYATLDLAGRVTAARGAARSGWLAGGAMSMGTGIWAMHYIGMLAFGLPVRVEYDLPTVIVSMLAAMAASLVALITVSRSRLAKTHTVLASVCMGCGIAAMHYIGMAAMRLPARLQYDPAVVAASVVVAVVISYAALVLTVRAREESRASWRKISTALVMGSAIPVMHYTGMLAVTFVPANDTGDLTHAVTITSLGVGAIAVVSVLVLLLAIGTAFLDRLVAAQRAVMDLARQQEDHFRTLAEAIPQIVWTAGTDGEPDFFNKRWHDYTGRAPEADAGPMGDGSDWRKAMHPEDVSPAMAAGESALRNGTTYEAESRFLRASDTSYRWHLVRAQPVRDAAGNIVKWFGTCTDIDDQKRNQKSLEDQVRQRTAALVEVNLHLTKEMRERAEAQRRMNQQTESLVKELTERSRKAALLARMGELLQSGTNQHEAFSIVTGYAPRIFPGWRGAIMLLNAARKLLEVEGVWEGCEFAPGPFDPSACWALRTGHRYLVEAGDRSATCAHAGAQAESYICVPVLAYGEALGVIHFQIPAGGATFSELEISLIEAFCEQIALAVANIRLREALRSQSLRDPLTGLYNRRYLEETFDREIHRVLRAQQPLGVLMLDLDHFKKVNDTFGHDAGDTVLKAIGALFARRLRGEDVACRFGGEEFVLILPNASLEVTRKRGEELCREAQGMAILHSGKPLGQITISAGVAAYPAHGRTSQELFAAADAALYRAKHAGRNCVVVATPASPEIEAATYAT